MQDANEFKELGNKEVQRKNYAKAAELYTKALRLRADPVFFANRSLCFFNLRQFSQALEDAEAATRTDPAYWKGYLRASQAHIAMGRFAEGIAVLRRAQELLPEEVHIRRELEAAEILHSYATSLDDHIAAGEWPEVVRKVDSLLAKLPPSGALLQKKVTALCFSGETDKAEKLLEAHAAQLEQESAEEYLASRATVERLSNRLDRARDLLAQGLRRFPQSVALSAGQQLVGRMDAAKEAGNAKFSANEFDEAIGAYNSALEVDPNNRKFNAVLRSNLASCYLKKKQLKEALAQARQATQLDPNYAKAFAKRAEIEKELKEYECSLNCFNRAKQLDPSMQLEGKIKAVAAEVKKAGKRDFYLVLGVDKKSSTEDIKKAYKKLVYKYHPDKNTGSADDQTQAEKRFKEVTEAYEVLSDPERRKRYDLGLTDDGSGGFNSQGFGGGSFNMNDIFGGGGEGTTFRMFFSPGSSNVFNMGDMSGFRAAGGGRQGGRGGQFSAADFGGINIDDILRQFGSR